MPAALEVLSPGVLLSGGVTALALGLWLLLPRGQSGHRERAARWFGSLLAIAALAAFIATGRRLGSIGEEGVFLVVSFVAVISATATIVSRSPVYAAIWFAMSLAGVAGVLLVLGAQFLGVATIVVYAGAILVMFLFVLMLAQPSGLAPYDRVSSEPFLAAVAGAVLLGLLSLSIGRLTASEVTVPAVTAGQFVAADADVLQQDHVARLGGELFSRHLVAVEAAGILLLIALVGSIAMVSRGEDARARERQAG